MDSVLIWQVIGLAEVGILIALLIGMVILLFRCPEENDAG